MDRSPMDDLLDPDGRYSAHGRRAVDRQAERVWAHLRQATISRTRDAIQFDVEEPEGGLVVLITAEALELRLPTVEWPAPYAPLGSSRLWKRVLWRRIENDERLAALIAQALAKRRGEFVPCRNCGESTPPEHRIGRACHGCASAHEGVVY